MIHLETISSAIFEGGEIGSVWDLADAGTLHAYTDIFIERELYVSSKIKDKEKTRGIAFPQMAKWEHPSSRAFGR